MRALSVLAALAVCIAAYAAKPPVKTKAPPLTPDQRAARSIMRSLSLRDKVAQLIVGVCYGDAPGKNSPEFQKYRHWVHDLHIGGFIVTTPSNTVWCAMPNRTLWRCFLIKCRKCPKFRCWSAQISSAAGRCASATAFAFPTIWRSPRRATSKDRDSKERRRPAKHALSAFNGYLRPIADVNNNPDNPVINIRSFGENPAEVSEHVVAFIEGARSDPKNRVILSVKHFPGHGDTNIDSHFGLPLLNASRERIDAVELKPFEAAMAHGADSVMSAHIAVPAIDSDGIPATASPKILTGLLRDELGFRGIIVTDAMDMQGFAAQFNLREGPVRAIEAGADVLLMPPNPEVAIRAVIAAVEDGRLSRKRIEESVMRVLAAKVRVGIMKKKLVDLDDISDALDSPEEDARVQEISDRAVTLVRNESNLLPLAAANQSCLVIAVGNRRSQFGQQTIAEFRRRAPNARSVCDRSFAAGNGDVG